MDYHKWIRIKLIKHNTILWRPSPLQIKWVQKEIDEIKVMYTVWFITKYWVSRSLARKTFFLGDIYAKFYLLDENITWSKVP
jgi:hypothetical protein